MNCSAPETNTGSKPGSGKRVLIVDDDTAILSMTKAMLGTAGYTTLTAPSGEQGVTLYREALAQGHTFDLVLLDLTLPGGISGMETLDQLLALDSEAHVIATSGFFEDSGSNGAAQIARRRGFQGILPKPFSSERLLRLVEVSITSAAA